MTLLVLDIKVSPAIPHGQLASALRMEAPEWFSFAVTFLLAGTFWTLQHRVYELLDRIDREGLVLTFIFLAFVSLLPFSTSLVSHHADEKLAFAIYLLNQFALASALTLKLEFAKRRGLAQPGLARAKLRLRLASLTVLLSAGTLCTFFLPIRYVVIPTIVIALAGKLAERRFERRYADVPVSKTLKTSAAPPSNHDAELPYRTG